MLCAGWERWNGRSAPRRATKLELRTIAKGVHAASPQRPSLRMALWARMGSAPAEPRGRR
eukprot:8541769-Lingulodinium_polyedra.AAC.1